MRVLIIRFLYWLLDRLEDGEPEAVDILRYATDLRDLAIASGKPGGLAVADALLYVIEYITDELGYRLLEDGGWEEK